MTNCGWNKGSRGIIAAAMLALWPQPPMHPRLDTGFLDRSVVVAGHAYRYQVFVPASYAPPQRLPVILFLHGSGEAGVDGLLQTQVGLGAAIRRTPSRYPAIVVFPQAPTDSLWVGGPAQMALAALDQTMQEFQTDPARVYLTGLSLGGNGVWYLGYRYPSRFAALVPIAGWVSDTVFRELKGFETAVPADSGPPFDALARQLKRVPIWIFHGEEDPVVPVEESRRAAAALQAAGGAVQYTELPGVEHNAWDPAYSSTKFVAWLFAQRRTP